MSDRTLISRVWKIAIFCVIEIYRVLTMITGTVISTDVFVNFILPLYSEFVQEEEYDSHCVINI